jgi:hypothetical protein
LRDRPLFALDFSRARKAFAKVNDGFPSVAVMNLHLDVPPSFDAFPYAKPYGIQDELMRHLYSAIENRRVTIVESPTGTVRGS